MDAYLHRTFIKKFNKLPLKIQAKFGERLELFLKDPVNEVLNNHSVEKAFPECRSINVTGDYRAVYKQEGDTAFFVNIGTHSELY